MPELIADSPGPGSRLGHFELLRELGAGGMGVVFEARDLRLGREVALKVLSPKLFEDELARARFFREAQLASSINHPNVATILEVDAQNQLPFVAMELVDGTNLKNLLRDGALPLPEVLRIGVQASRALQAAHEKGVIHRDVKSSNIMVTPDGRVKVLDFGLAKSVNEASDPLPAAHRFTSDATPNYFERAVESSTGQAVGTLSYMSPEQTAGGEVDPRSDIFSIGVVLYEAVTGRLPFRGTSEQELIAAIQSSDPPSPRVYRRKVPKSFSRVVERCLAKSPGDRFATAGELSSELNRLLSTLSWKGVARRTAPMAAVAGALVAALLWYPEPGPPARETAGVVFSTVENQTEDERLDAVSTLFETELAQSPRLRLLGVSEKSRVLRQMMLDEGSSLDREQTMQLAFRAGAPFVVGGSLSRLGDAYLLTIRVERLGSDSPSEIRTWTESFAFDGEPQAFAAVDQAGLWTRQTLGESAVELPEFDAPVREATTPSWDALHLYVRARELYDASRFEEGLLLLEEAVQLDPEFAMAHALMADILQSRDEKRSLLHWNRAFEATEKRSVTERESLRIRGSFTFHGGDYPAAVSVYRLYALRYPSDPEPLYREAWALRELGRFQQAIQRFHAADALWPRASGPTGQIATTYLRMGRYREARDWADRLRALGSTERADKRHAMLDYLEGRYEDALAGMRAITASGHPLYESYGHLWNAWLLHELGRYGESLQAIEVGVRVDERNGERHAHASKELLRAHMHLQRGDLRAAREAALRALELNSGARMGAEAGTILARAGFLDEARRVSASMDVERSAPIFSIARERILGEVLLQEGRPEPALERLRRAAALEPSSGHPGYLVRALHATEQHADAFARFADSPVTRPTHETGWSSLLDTEFPGLFSEELFLYARISLALGHRDLGHEALLRYLEIRGRADPGLLEVQEARRLVEDHGEAVAQRP